jgi:MFS family permease
VQGASDGRERGVKGRLGRRTVGGLLIGGAVGAVLGAILGGVIYGFMSGWELVFLLVGLIFGAGTGALVMGMSSLGSPEPGDEPRS